MNTENLNRLHGGNVLVKSAHDRHDPPIALRGTLDTMTTPGVVKIVLEYPDMCVAPAHHDVIRLDAEGVDRLLVSERDGVYEVTVPETLESVEPPETPQAAS
jgi:hypothetical protein